MRTYIVQNANCLSVCAAASIGFAVFGNVELRHGVVEMDDLMQLGRVFPTRRAPIGFVRERATLQLIFLFAVASVPHFHVFSPFT